MLVLVLAIRACDKGCFLIRRIQNILYAFVIHKFSGAESKHDMNKRKCVFNILHAG